MQHGQQLLQPGAAAYCAELLAALLAIQGNKLSYIKSLRLTRGSRAPRQRVHATSPQVPVGLPYTVSTLSATAWQG
jgi:hypothetical protein